MPLRPLRSPVTIPSSLHLCTFYLLLLLSSRGPHDTWLHLFFQKSVPFLPASLYHFYPSLSSFVLFVFLIVVHLSFISSVLMAWPPFPLAHFHCSLFCWRCFVCPPQ